MSFYRVSPFWGGGFFSKPPVFPPGRKEREHTTGKKRISLVGSSSRHTVSGEFRKEIHSIPKKKREKRSKSAEKFSSLPPTSIAPLV